MKAVLVDRDLDGVVDGSEVSTPETAATWKRKNKQALSQIILSIADSELVHTIGAATAQEAMERLKAVYQVKGLAQSLYLRTKLVNMSLSDGDSMQQYINQMKGLVQQLQEIGVTISQEEQITTLLMRLPDYYKPLITSLDTLGSTTTLSIDMVIARLLAEEKRRNETKTNSETALYSQSASQSSQHRNAAADRSSNSSNSCSHCGNTGHTKATCWQIIGRPQRGRNKYGQSVSLVAGVEMLTVLLLIPRMC